MRHEVTHFEKIFGNRVSVKVLQLLVEKKGRFFSVREIARRLKVSESSVARVLNTLTMHGIVECVAVSSAKARKVYRLRDGPLAKKLRELHEALQTHFERLESSGDL
ncbi:MAG: hypothetical protein DRJ57_00670 [Thermoprotei archaeon]|nr:MAG: hypothetical protein DRJ57_00670 [Thermoprotei archaeon]